MTPPETLCIQVQNGEIIVTNKRSAVDYLPFQKGERKLGGGLANMKKA